MGMVSLVMAEGWSEQKCANAFISLCIMLAEKAFLSPGDLPDPGIEPRFPALQADALPSEPRGKPQL